MLYFGAQDGFLVALDAQTGKLRWETKVDNGQITAGGLLVADGKVISNRTCQQAKREFCFIAAHDARPAERSGSSMSPRRPASPVAKRGGRWRSRKGRLARGACLARTIRSVRSCIGVWPIPIPTHGSNVTAATMRSRSPLQ